MKVKNLSLIKISTMSILSLSAIACSSTEPQQSSQSKYAPPPKQQTQTKILEANEQKSQVEHPFDPKDCPACGMG
ncbi:hypothetical protein EXE10_04330 [Acinetobacter sp. WCHAc060033]|uniref:hypothetical protein n=1 Tax=Acinetobacter sp. WCHAc060033 TaxID=2518624 RepID=UPI00102382F6|nr:hypothetical protein [Acinetobacter sp. WCHAc060033]RZG87553.1 hypothetical protein EXE10_04330 [Acinetobacter sp. WCHAc060033]